MLQLAVDPALVVVVEHVASGSRSRPLPAPGPPAARRRAPAPGLPPRSAPGSRRAPRRCSRRGGEPVAAMPPAPCPPSPDRSRSLTDHRSAGEGADQAAAGGGGLLDGGDRVGRFRVGGDLDPLAEGVDREPVVVSRALGRARAGPGGLAGAVAEL